ncbi:MAG TPA: LysR family transcriptional regulator [Xanthobacteraceae bacterium]|jgi:hypothetical protein
MDRLAALEIFVRVVDTGSLSAGARNPQIGLPAVSKAVVPLEEWLGIRRSTQMLCAVHSVARPTESLGSVFSDQRD